MQDLSRYALRGASSRLDKDPATVSRWCNNHSQPSVETFARIAEILNIDMRTLFNT